MHAGGENATRQGEEKAPLSVCKVPLFCFRFGVSQQKLESVIIFGRFRHIRMCKVPGRKRLEFNQVDSTSVGKKAEGRTTHSSAPFVATSVTDLKSQHSPVKRC